MFFMYEIQISRLYHNYDRLAIMHAKKTTTCPSQSALFVCQSSMQKKINKKISVKKDLC